jgi:hypothetical protein
MKRHEVLEIFKQNHFKNNDKLRQKTNGENLEIYKTQKIVNF